MWTDRRASTPNLRKACLKSMSKMPYLVIPPRVFNQAAIFRVSPVGLPQARAKRNMHSVKHWLDVSLRLCASHARRPKVHKGFGGPRPRVLRSPGPPAPRGSRRRYTPNQLSKSERPLLQHLLNRLRPVAAASCHDAGYNGLNAFRLTPWKSASASVSGLRLHGLSAPTSFTQGPIRKELRACKHGGLPDLLTARRD